LKPPNPTNAGSPERVTVGDVVASFTDTAATYGLPAATLTDNGSVYTSRFTHGHNDFERLIASLGVTQRNGHPGHPQTQGKIERFHRTLKLWLIGRRRPSTITEAQTQLDDFRVIYNTQRPHRAHHPRATPQSAYLARPKATPAQATEHFRIRHDIVDQFGKLTLRYGSRRNHLGIGRCHAATPVLILTAAASQKAPASLSLVTSCPASGPRSRRHEAFPRPRPADRSSYKDFRAAVKADDPHRGRVAPTSDT
jgi:hypothetical protein